MASLRLRSIQVLRGLAALMVVAHHAITIPHGPSLPSQPLVAKIPSLDQFGCAGVDIFFVISGFIMAHTLGQGSEKPSATSFLLRRALRIAPMFWIVTLLFIISEWLEHRTLPGARSLLNALTIVPLSNVQTFVTNPAPLYLSWTMAFELCFYGIIAGSLLIGKRNPVTLALAITLIAALIGIVSQSDSSPGTFMTNAIQFEFALGIVAWLVWRHGSLNPYAPLFSVLGVLLFGMGLAVDWGQGFNPSPQAVMFGQTGVVRSMVWGVPAFLLVFGAAGDRGATPGVVANLLERIGDASYAIYLVHPIILASFCDLGGQILPRDHGLFVPAIMLTSIIAGIVLTHYIERPIAAWFALQRYSKTNLPVRGRADPAARHTVSA